MKENPISEGEIVTNSNNNTEKSKKKKRTSNFEIMIITYFFVFLFLAIIVYLCYVTLTNKQELFNNSYNSRQKILSEKNYRGTIYSKDGEVLAETTINSDDTEERVYPYDNTFAHIIGYIGSGKSGIESMGNYYLSNSNIDLIQKATNSDNNEKNAGDNIYTTLDVALQEAAYKALGVYDGAVIVTDISTGKILAMVSKPDFDPNEISTNWEKLVEDTENAPLLNRVTQGLYPPGSTFKIITALEYLRENTDTYQHYSYNCTGIYQLGENTISCYHGEKHGQVDFYDSFVESCNTSFVNIGLSLDSSQFSNTLEQLLFMQELPINLSYSKSSISIDEETSDFNIAQSVIGQGKTQMTPMHLNMITQAIANNGILMSPYVIERVESANGKLIEQFNPEKYGELMTVEEATILTEMMTGVVEDGTASKLSGYSYSAAGKTGSAEYNATKGASHAWFTGFAPAEDPQICVTVIVEGAGNGGDYAVPIARRIFDAYFAE